MDILSIIAFGFMGLVVLFLVLSSYGLNCFLAGNEIASSSRRAHKLWKIPGTLAYSFVAYKVYQFIDRGGMASLYELIYTPIVLVLGVAANFGFRRN